MRSFLPNIKSSYMALLGKAEITPDLVVARTEAIRKLMLAEIGETGENNFTAVARRVRYAPDVQGLWYVRSELMGLLSSVHGETIAQEKIASISAQFASLNLPSAEKISLGGPNGGQGIRAYPVGEASGDEGYVGTLEARYTNPAWKLGNASTIVSAFYDFGGVTISKNPIAGVNNKRNLAGAGLGVTLGKEGDFTVRASMAWRVSSEKPLSDADRSPRFWLEANKAF